MIDTRINTMNWTRTTLILVFVALIISDIIFISKYFGAVKRASQAEAAVSTANSNAKILAFTGLFIEKVLQSNTEISFDDRLIIENSVRDLKDTEISAAWQKFVQSRDEKVAQMEVTNLLKLLIEKARR